MNKNVWKVLFDLMSDDDLHFVAKHSGVKIKGFRVVTSAPRTMLITQMMTPAHMKKVRTFLNLKTETDEHLAEYRNYNKEELLERLRAGEDPFDVLFALLSSTETGQQLLGDLIVSELDSTGELARLASAYYAPVVSEGEDNKEDTSAEAPAVPPAKEPEPDNRIARKLEKKYDTLKQQHDQLQTEYQEKRKEWEQELKELRTQLRDKQTLEGQFKKLTEEHKKCTDTQSLLQKDLNHKQAMINNLEKDKDKAMQEKKMLESKLQALMQLFDQQGNQQVANSAVTRASQSARIVMIGKTSKINRELSAQRDHIVLLDVDQVEQELESLLPEATQVWMLTYETPLPKQRSIRQMVDRQRLKEFKDYVMVKSHINR